MILFLDLMLKGILALMGFLSCFSNMDLIKHDLFSLFRDWEKGELGLYRLNFSLLTLVPKEVDAVRLEKFRPLAMTICGFKIFSKCATNNFGPIFNELISPNQTAFIKGRFIVESIVAAHEMIHVLATKKGLVLCSN